MSPLRWAISIIGFPLGGLAAIQLGSTTDGPLSAALAGLVAGAILGTAQWLALRPRVGALWIAATSVGLALGSAIGAAITGGADNPTSLALFGAVSGAIVGLAQGIVLGRAHLAIWIATVAGSWTLAWLITQAVIVDEQKGFVLFGLSGAALATIATGLVLRLRLGARDTASALEAVSA
jgi:hypothetical protein